MLLRTKPARFVVKRLATNLLPSYYSTLIELRRTETMTRESLDRVQLQKLKSVLLHAYHKVPYYKKRFSKRGLNPGALDQLYDFRDYPFLDRETLRENTDSLVANRIVRRLGPPVYTGGTTGTPLRLYRSVSDYGRERAFLEYAYRMAGIDPFARTVYLRGPVDDIRRRYHHASVLCHTLFLSSNNMDDGKLALYVRLMRAYRPVVLYALPSVATVLAEYMDRNQVALIPSLRHAFLPSENLYEFQVRLIERVFHCTISTHYGHSEHAVFAARCSKGPLYHVVPQYGYAELIDEHGRPVTKEGQWGEIVGTSFTNSICPLIRYRTGDFAVYTRERCGCGRNYPMWKRIRGREQSVAIAKNGGRISVGPELLCTLHNRSYGEIRQFQIRQVKKGELEIHITPHRPDGFRKARDFFTRFFREQFPGMFDIRVIARQPVPGEKIPEKHLYFIQGITGGLGIGEDAGVAGGADPRYD